jgi:hypothetical protein
MKNGSMNVMDLDDCRRQKIIAWRHEFSTHPATMLDFCLDLSNNCYHKALFKLAYRTVKWKAAKCTIDFKCHWNRHQTSCSKCVS